MSGASSVEQHSVATEDNPAEEKPLCKRLKVSCKDNCVICYYDDQCVGYVSPTWDEDRPGLRMMISRGYKKQRFDKIIKTDDFEKVAFDALASLLKNPNLQLELFSFNFDDSDDYSNKGIKFDGDKIRKFFDRLKKMETILESIDHQLPVKACGIRIPNRCSAMSILPYLKPGVLEKISILSDDPGPGFDYGYNEMQQIASLEQWKQAEELELRSELTSFVKKYATHFKRFQFYEYFDILGFRLELPIRQLKLLKLSNIRDYISEHESAESCSILCNYRNMDEFRGIVGIKVSPNSSHYSIPNSDDYLEFVFTKNNITIEKKKSKQLMEQSNENLSKAMEQLTVTADDSNEASKPPKSLEDLTVDVIGLIIEKSDYKQQLNLRKTSRTLRSLVDKHQPALTHLKVSCYYDYILCHYDDHCVIYIQPNWHHSNLVEYSKYDLDSIVSNFNYQQDAFNDLASVLKNPKLQLEYFSFNIDSDGYEANGMDCDDDLGFHLDWTLRGDYKKMQNMLESINHQLSVKECRTDICSDIKNIMSFLPFLKPGVLEKITLFMGDLGEDSDRCIENFKQISLLEQWKQAKELEMEDGMNDIFPTEYATHFKRFLFAEMELDWDRFIWIRDYILKHENAEFCLITDYHIYQNLKYEEFVRRVGTRVSPNMSHYTVPDSEYYLEFKHVDEAIEIEKKKKKSIIVFCN